MVDVVSRRAVLESDDLRIIAVREDADTSQDLRQQSSRPKHARVGRPGATRMTVKTVDEDDVDQRGFLRTIDLSQAVSLDLVGICHGGRLTCWQDPDKKVVKEIKTSGLFIFKGDENLENMR